MDKNPQAAQSEAAALLLDLGVSIPMRAPWLFRKLGKKNFRVTMRRPYWGTMARISKAWLSMDVSANQIGSQSLEDDLKLIRDHGRTVAKIVALGILRGYCSGWFAGLLGRFLLWKVHPTILVEAAYKLVTLSRVEDFTTTIRLLGAMNVMKSLSPEIKGS